jgi:UDP-glucose 4-epimerase
MSTPKRALVLGGNGFIGSNLVRGLVASGVAARILDLRREAALPSPGPVDFVEGDFTNRALLERALEERDAVFHLASATIPASGTGDPVHDVTENLVGTLRLIEACVARGVRRIVFASSGGTVYGRPRQVPIPEDHPQDPINSYAIVKLAIEKYLAMYAHLGRVDPVIVRISNPYGPGQFTRGAQGAIAVALGCLLRGEPFRLWGDGGVVRDFLYVDDLTRALLAAAAAPPDGPRVYNVGSGTGISLRDVLVACERAAGRRLVIERLPGRAIDVPANVLDCARARQHLGWSPCVPLTEGLARTWAWVAGDASGLAGGERPRP